jgi:hypothetical protein
LRVIDYGDFRRLRLADVLAPTEIVALHDWEFDGRLWVGEAHGFSEWLRLTSAPEELGSIALDLSTFPHAAAREVFSRLVLPIHAGMTIEELESILGPKRSSQRFIPDRVTYQFVTAGPEPFRISCTVLNEGGLTYLGVMTPPLAEAE